MRRDRGPWSPASPACEPSSGPVASSKARPGTKPPHRETRGPGEEVRPGNRQLRWPAGSGDVGCHVQSCARGDAPGSRGGRGPRGRPWGPSWQRTCARRPGASRQPRRRGAARPGAPDACLEAGFRGFGSEGPAARLGLHARRRLRHVAGPLPATRRLHDVCLGWQGAVRVRGTLSHRHASKDARGTRKPHLSLKERGWPLPAELPFKEFENTARNFILARSGNGARSQLRQPSPDAARASSPSERPGSDAAWLGQRGAGRRGCPPAAASAPPR